MLAYVYVYVHVYVYAGCVRPGQRVGWDWVVSGDAGPRHVAEEAMPLRAPPPPPTHPNHPYAGPIGLVAYFLLRLPFSGGKKATASRKSKNS